MNSRSPSLIELHWEKVLLGASAALALYLAWGFLLTSPNAVDYQGRRIRPSELNDVVLQEALYLEQRMRDAATTLPQVPQYHDQLRKLHAAGIFSPEAESGAFRLPRQLRLAAAFGAPFHVPILQHAPVRLVTPLPPTRPVVETGRCLLASENGDTRQSGEDLAREREATWVRIRARFDVKQQCDAMLAAGYPPYAARFYLAGVDAQRQELRADGGFSEWQHVRPHRPPPSLQIPTPLFDDNAHKLLNRDALDAAFDRVKASQELLTRPAFEDVIAGDRPPTIAEQPADVEDAEGSDSLVLWVHDTSVEPGQSYRYRLRVRLWNRFVGRRRAVQDADDAERAVLAGAWSAPSEVVTAAPRYHLFLLGRSIDGTMANFEVWAWHRGRWLRKSFTAAVGDVVGGLATVRTGDVDERGRPIREKVDFNTGVVVLDMRVEAGPTRITSGETGRFEWLERPTLVTVCLDPADGRVRQRSQIADLADPIRKQLREEVDNSPKRTAETDKRPRPRPPRPRP